MAAKPLAIDLQGLFRAQTEPAAVAAHALALEQLAMRGDGRFEKIVAAVAAPLKIE